MSKKLLLVLPFLALLLGLTAYAAVNPFNIKFPIAELGNCGSLDACKVYCDDPANTDDCLRYGQSHGLIKKDESDQAQRIKENIKSSGGPGGCTSFDACRQYCADPSHLNECSTFAQKNGIVNQQRRTVQDAINKGDVPVAGCTSEETCKQLCNLPENHDACLAWARSHGIVTASNAQNLNQGGKQPPLPNPEQGINRQKAIQIIQQYGGPGGCVSFDACSQFCSKPENQKTCSDYAQKYGLISQDEAKRADKLIGKIGPGGCRGDACRLYCADQTHRDECFKFALDNGVISKEQADKMNQPPIIRSVPPPGLSRECLEAKQSGNYERARQLCNLPPLPPSPSPRISNSICPQITPSECPVGLYQRRYALPNGCPASRCVSGQEPSPSFTPYPKSSITPFPSHSPLPPPPSSIPLPGATILQFFLRFFK